MIALVNPPGIKTFSGLQMHTPNPPLGLAYVVALERFATFLRTEFAILIKTPWVMLRGLGR